MDGNENLKRNGILQWTIPAWAGKMDDGTRYNTCPSAGECVKICYARTGNYVRFPGVRKRHQENLRFVLEDLAGWEKAMLAELARPKMIGKYVRIHDAGDFFSAEYTAAWLRIMRQRPQTTFYCYTKEVLLFKELVEPDPPANFKWCYSLGGKHDQLLDLETDRVCDVFPTEAAVWEAGWFSQEKNDLLAVEGPAPVGMGANNIQHLKKLQGGRRLSEMQREADEAKRVRDARRPGRRSTGPS
ncbi:hypothetical protein D5S17_35665 [Pseudonocardiaceae bacterium YIM PH 21723]|nr:hypothetical protein D5S17_35665 [Pseudonocardiaceae bacterium YIM PH 21723]